MAVQVNTEREAVQITYDASLTDSPTVYARYSSGHGDGNGEDEVDVSTGDPHANNGFDVVTYPKGHTGTTHVDMIDEDGNAFDSGDITR